jgi:hypothetical protein
MAKTGMALSVVVPLPNWPLKLDPQAQTVPSCLKANVCHHPADNAEIFVMSAGPGMVMPIPNWLSLLFPTDRTPLSARTAGASIAAADIMQKIARILIYSDPRSSIEALPLEAIYS